MPNTGNRTMGYSPGWFFRVEIAHGFFQEKKNGVWGRYWRVTSLGVPFCDLQFTRGVILLGFAAFVQCHQMLEWYYFFMENYAVAENSVIQWTYWKQFGVCLSWKYDWNRMKTVYWDTSYTITFERWHFLATPTEEPCPQARPCEHQSVYMPVPGGQGSLVARAPGGGGEGLVHKYLASLIYIIRRFIYNKV